jgi:ElaA protein
MGDIVVIRVLNAEAKEAAFAIRRAVFVDEQKVDLPLEFDGLDDDAEHLVAMLDGTPVGTLRLRRVDDETGKIERVAVLKQARGRSIGHALLQAALSQLKEDGVSRAKLHAQTHALDFYAKLGFSAFGEVFDEDGIPHRAMLRDL